MNPNALALAAAGWLPVGREPTTEAHDFEIHVRAALDGDVSGVTDACVVHALVVDGRPVERTYYGHADLVADLVSLVRCWRRAA